MVTIFTKRKREIPDNKTFYYYLNIVRRSENAESGTQLWPFYNFFFFHLIIRSFSKYVSYRPTVLHPTRVFFFLADTNARCNARTSDERIKRARRRIASLRATGEKKDYRTKRITRQRRKTLCLFIVLRGREEYYYGAKRSM